MSTINIENGKRIDELTEISSLSSIDSFFAVSINSMTRKISITNLRNAFSGDDAMSNLNNLYYTAEKVSMLFQNVYSEIAKNASSIDNMEKRIASMYDNIGSELSDFKRAVEAKFAFVYLELENVRNEMAAMEIRINNRMDATRDAMQNYVDGVETELRNYVDGVDTELRNYINNVDTQLRGDVNNLNTELRTFVNNTVKSLTDRVAALEAKLAGITSITIGSSIPSSLASGAVYLQYF